MKNLFKDLKEKKDDYKGILTSNYGESNKTCYWRFSDTQSNLDNLKDNFAKEYWTNRTLEYRYNNYGFRSDDNFNNNDEGIVTLGCSFTEGIGLPIEYTWGYKLSKYLGLKFWNLGQGAMGLHTCFRLLLGMANKIKFNKVFLLSPPLYRKEFIAQDNNMLKGFLDEQSKTKNLFHTLGQDLKYKKYFNTSDKDYNNFLKAWLFGSRKDTVIDQIRSIYAIEGLCKDLNVDFYYENFYTFYNKKYLDLEESIPEEECPNIPARDGHWSARRQHLIYKKFIELYENNNR